MAKTFIGSSFKLKKKKIEMRVSALQINENHA